MASVFIVSLLVLLCSVQAMSYGCGSGWKVYRGFCYKFSTNKKIYREANEACEASGATLASIWSQAEQNFIASHLISSAGSYWFGFDDRSSEGTFDFIDESPVTYKNWYGTHEPNNANGGEDCGMLKSSRSWKWNDGKCSGMTLRYVCKKCAS